MNAPRRNPSAPPPTPRPLDARPQSEGAGSRPEEAGPTGEEARLRTESATIGYDGRIISRELTTEIPDGSFTAIIGPNGCGKSTLLRALARILAPSEGRVLLDGKEIGSRPPKEVARRLGLLPQTSLAPDGIRVADLVARGRAPYQGLFQQWRAEDESAVGAALEATRLTDLSGRLVEELSGGQRQRVWVAMLLAQGTELMLLDEPTTFLDIAHQYELMELLRGFHEQGRTLVAVLHDLGQAARYADHLIVMHEGRVVTTGPPAEVITAELVERVFGLRCLVVPDPVTGTPTVVPLDPRTAPLAPADDPAAAGGADVHPSSAAAAPADAAPTRPDPTAQESPA